MLQHYRAHDREQNNASRCLLLQMEAKFGGMELSDAKRLKTLDLAYVANFRRAGHPLS